MKAKIRLEDLIKSYIWHEFIDNDFLKEFDKACKAYIDELCRYYELPEVSVKLVYQMTGFHFGSYSCELNMIILGFWLPASLVYKFKVLRHEFRHYYQFLRDTRRFTVGILMGNDKVRKGLEEDADRFADMPDENDKLVELRQRINELAEEHLKSVRELARENEEVFYVLTGCNPDEFFEQKRYLPGEERVGENVDLIFRAKAKKGKAKGMIFDLWYKNGLPLRGSPLL